MRHSKDIGTGDKFTAIPKRESRSHSAEKNYKRNEKAKRPQENRDDSHNPIIAFGLVNGNLLKISQIRKIWTDAPFVNFLLGLKILSFHVEI
jgi:hypothetical protein